jgi:hypothetical protein
MVAVFRKVKIWMLVPLGFLVGKTLSSVLGIELSLMFVFTIILLKYHEFYGSTEDDNEPDEKDEELLADETSVEEVSR